MSATNSSHYRLQLILVLVIIVSYANALDGPFQFDDIVNIQQNHLLQNVQDLGGFTALFRSCPTRFVGFLSFAWNVVMTGLEPFWFHATNIAIHIFVTLMLYKLATQFIKHKSASVAAFVGALFFGVHPVQTQAVTYIVQRFTSLAACFYLISLASYYQGVVKERRWFFLGSWISGLFAVLTKEYAVTLPAAVLAMEILLLGTRPQDLLKHWRRLAPLCTLPFVPVMAIILIGNNNALDLSLNKAQSPALPIYLMTQCHVLLRYLELIIWPTGQNLDYSFPLTNHPDLVTIMIAFLPFAAVFVAWRWRRLCPVASFGIVLFILGLAVETLIPLPDVIFEHRLYLSMAGIALCIAAAIAETIEVIFQQNRRPYFIPFTIANILVLIVLAVATRKRNEVWLSATAMWSDVLAKAPTNDRAYDNLSGFLLLEKGNVPAALGVVQRWRQLHPPAVTLVLKEADYLSRMDRLAEASQVLSEAQLSYPDSAPIALAHIKTLIDLGDYPAAAAHAERLLKSIPNDITVRASVALARHAAGMGKAEELLIGSDIEDSSPAALLARGKIRAEVGQYREALKDLENAFSLAHDNTEICLRVVDVHVALGQPQEASTIFQKCRYHLSTDYRQLMHTGNNLDKAGLHGNAIFAWQVALDLCLHWQPSCPRVEELRTKLAGANPSLTGH